MLQGWIDWNGNDNFDVSEALTFTSAGAGAVPNGGVTNQQYCFTVPSGATFSGGKAYMRFRLSSAGSLSWTGPADNGEVEDYCTPLACVGNYVWIDNGSYVEYPGRHRHRSDQLGRQADLCRHQRSLETAVGAASPSGDDTLYSTTTSTAAVSTSSAACPPSATDGVDVPIPPASRNPSQRWQARAAHPDQDSNGTQSGGSGGPTGTGRFTIPRRSACANGERQPGLGPPGSASAASPTTRTTYRSTSASAAHRRR